MPRRSINTSEKQWVAYIADQQDVLSVKDKGVWERANGLLRVESPPEHSLECVAFVKKVVPELFKATKWWWYKGMPVWIKVRGVITVNPDLPDLCAIACGWSGGKYPSRPTGNHACIFVKHGSSGRKITVYDQYDGNPVERRVKTYSAQANGDYAAIVLPCDANPKLKC